MKDQFDAVSLINVLSHVQDFHAVLAGRDFCWRTAAIRPWKPATVAISPRCAITRPPLSPAQPAVRRGTISAWRPGEGALLGRRDEDVSCRHRHAVRTLRRRSDSNQIVCAVFLAVPAPLDTCSPRVTVSGRTAPRLKTMHCRKSFGGHRSEAREYPQ